MIGFLPFIGLVGLEEAASKSMILAHAPKRGFQECHLTPWEIEHLKESIA